ncbi:hypothetical protein pEaSNUABM17_00299 [Erwinia phage pEa_SNUABM_17]|uniref:HD domain-containing protein n=1 Tax=Erwinia phage pEa_SNUABM_17 TaxID=2869545 RepID=A0AAE7XLS2_9CAUD|nr:phosphohydrolase [Erwinia phage pEa_SNUABM_17]QZE57845.1 hypothetical protein pEaSNUABM17_00299 [Erwinia phage pEa_SNUABM_17]
MTKMTNMPFSTSLERNAFFNEHVLSLDLWPVWKYVDANNNPQWQGDPLLHHMHYHSTEHMKQVTALALWLLLQEMEYQWQYDNGALPLAVACMFHDMHHSLGRLSDEVNVRTSQDAFKQYLTVCEDQRIKDHEEIILDLIGVTQFPYMKNRQPKNLIERCIRDADILYGMQDDALDVVMFALRREVNRSVNTPTHFTAEQWAAGRVDFLMSVEMYTPTANTIMDWLLVQDNDHNHQAKIDSWMRDNVIFRDTTANKLRANDVLFIDTESDSTPKRRLIERVESVHPYINFYFHDGEALSLRDGESCVVCERRK